MSRDIIFYPVLTKERLEPLNCKNSSFEALYSDQEKDIFLEYTDEHEQGIHYYSIQDNTGNWSPDKYNIMLKGCLEVENTDTLFEENGVVPKDAKLGIGLVWKSRASSLRGSEIIGEISYGDKRKSIPFKKSFEKAFLRGNVEFEFELYLLQAGSDKYGMAPGISFGQLMHLNILLEGIGSTFTVFEKDAPGEPLWSVECEWDEPEYSLFSDSVRVIINTAHPAWIISSADEDMKKELLKEIMASSMQIVIAQLEEDQYDGSNEYEQGSVSDEIAYLASRASLKMDSPSNVAKSIRAYLDRNIG